MRKILTPQKPRRVQWAVRPSLKRGACRGQQGARDEIVLRVVIVNGLAAILFMIGYPLFGVAMIRTATLPRWSGVLVAVGAPAPFAGFRDSSAGFNRRLVDREPGQYESAAALLTACG
jgi:hypothetical protein